MFRTGKCTRKSSRESQSKSFADLAKLLRAARPLLRAACSIWVGGRGESFFSKIQGRNQCPVGRESEGKKRNPTRARKTRTICWYRITSFLQVLGLVISPDVESKNLLPLRTREPCIPDRRLIQLLETHGKLVPR